MSHGGHDSCLYKPGTWLLFRGGSAVLLADVEVGSVLVRDLWALVAADAPLDALLRLIAVTDRSALPSFALAHLHAGRRVVLRGSATVRLDDAERLSCPAGITSWLEHPVDVSVESLTLLSGQVGADEELPLLGGISRASSVHLGQGASNVSAPPGVVAATAVDELPTTLGVPAPLSGASPPVPEADPRVGGAYDYLFEATQARSIGAAAVREVPPVPEPSLEPSVEVEVVERGVDAAPAAHGVEGGDGAVPAPPETAAPGDQPIIAAVPGMPFRTPTTYQPPASMIASEVEERTVSRAAPRPSFTPPPGTVTIKALRCRIGHANPPQNTTCRICGAEVPAGAPIDVPQPNLGVIRLSTGATFALDRAAILGRDPRPTGAPGFGSPHLIRVPSPGSVISRVHLEVTLDGWHVLVVDPGTPNGTFVTIPGTEQQRLRPSEPLQIPPGTVVNLADEVTFVYEASG